MKMNKKGFTLIEMLVVIAIIAILVAIIIPTVTSATTKAAAATNAANLRSIQAEASVDYLSGGDNTDGLVHYNATSKTFTVQASAPKAKAVDGMAAAETAATVELDANNNIVATYGTFTIAQYAAKAS